MAQLEAGSSQLEGRSSQKVKVLSLADLDKRSSAARRASTLINMIMGDLGGKDQVSTGEQQIVQRAVFLGTLAEDIEARWLAGEEVDPTVLATIANAQRRLLGVGLRRRQKDVSPSLEGYLATKERA
jgi:hypothetical protein